jgi:peptidoglycan/LPS O-acetylase OafA/YrhL
MNRKEYRKAVFIICLTLGVLGGVVVWIRSPDKEINLTEVGTVAGVILVVGFALFLAFRRLRSVKENLPAEDEMSKKLLRRSAATSYYLSIYLWLGLMMLADKVDLETHSWIGAGILGMAILYALSWIYHRYFSRIHD